MTEGMASSAPTIAMVCGFPPPVHGASIVSQRMREGLSQEGFHIVSIDTSPLSLRRGFKYYAARLWRLARIWRLLFLSREASIYCYVNAGWGVVIDLLVAAIARVRGTNLWLHHHSFSYLNQKSKLHFAAFYINRGRSHHIVLCEYMKEKLVGSYPANADHVHVLSNVNFIEPAIEIASQDSSDILTIGFLSNISEEKGIGDFLRLSESLRELPVRFEIAGPIADQKFAWLERAKSSSEDKVQWVGPLNEAEKSKFLSRIHILAFPTRYQHEAEPLVIYEAMGAGVAVVAYDRGCIREMIEPPHQLVRTFDGLEAEVRALVMNLPDRASIAESYQRRRERSRDQLLLMRLL